MKNSSSKNIKVGAVLTYLTQFLSIAISFVYVPIMLGRLGQSEYGLYSIVQSLVAYLQMSEMGIGTTAIRYNSKYIEEGNLDGQMKINGMFFKIYLGIAAICVAVATVLYLFLDSIYADYSPDNIRLIKILFVIAVVNLVITFVFQIFNAIVIAYEEYIFLKVISLIQTIIGPVCMLAVLFMGLRSIGMLCVTTVLSLIIGLIQMIFCLKKYKIEFSLRAHDSNVFKKILSFTIFVFINSMATQLMMNSDKVVISIIMTEYAVAVYAIVMQFYVYSYNFSNVLSGFYLPRFTKIIAKEKSVSTELFDDLVRTGRIQVFVAGLIFGGFLAIGHPFIIRWAGPEYGGAYWLTVIVLVTEVIGASQSMFNSLMQAMNLHKMRAFLSLIVSLVKIMLTIVMTKCFGLIGCAVAFLFGWIVKQIVFNIYYSKRVGLNIKGYWLKMCKMFIPLAVTVSGLFVTSTIAQRIVPATNYPVLLVYALIYCVFYVTIMWFIALDTYEKSVLIGAFKKIWRKR